MNLSRTRFTVLMLPGILWCPVMAQDVPAPAAPEKTNPQASYDAAVAELDLLETFDIDDITASSMEALNKHLAALQTSDPSHPRMTYLFARAAGLSGRTKDAITQLRRFVETREGRTDWEAHRRLGDLFVDEFPQLAKASYVRAADLKAGEPTVLLGLSNCAYKLGRLDDAVAIAKEAADADGRKTVRVVSHLARMFIAKQNWSEADRAATAAMELADAQVKAHPGQRAALRVMDAQCKLTVDLLQARIADRSAGAEDFLRLAGLFRMRNDLSAVLNLHECVRILEAGVNASGEKPSTALLVEYAGMLAEVGRTADAIVAYEKVLALDPQNAAAAEQVKKLR